MLPHPAMQDWRQVLGTNVRRLRQARGLTQEQVAFDAEIDLTYLGGIERGNRNPSLLVIARVAKALSVRPGDLLVVESRVKRHPVPTTGPPQRRKSTGQARRPK